MQQSNLDNLIINKMTQAQYDTITPNSNELYLITDGVLQSSDVINALGYTPVNKTGDVMTGNLAVLNGTPRFYLRDSNEVAGTSPSANITKQLNFQDNNSTLVGYVGNSYLTTGERYTVVASKDASGNNGTEIRVGYDANGNVFTYAPQPASNATNNTIATVGWCDGNWTSSASQVVSSVSLNYGSNYSIGLSSYLPNDDNLYEVTLTARATSGAAINNFAPIHLTLSNYGADILVCYARSYTSAANYANGCLTFYAKSSTTMALKRSTDYRGTADIWFLGYRKVR